MEGLLKSIGNDFLIRQRRPQDVGVGSSGAKFKVTCHNVESG
jgi:hypothetical protein